MKKILFTILTLLLPMVANAYDAQIDGIYYNFDTTNNTAEVTYLRKSARNSSAYSGDIAIPGEVSFGGKSLSVTSIGDYAFYYCNSLTTITIPNSVTSIGERAFRYCSKLTAITIPDSVTSIGESAFEGCSNLTSITIPDGVTSIESNTFDGCSGLTSVTIPSSVTAIGEKAFQNCFGLTSVYISDIAAWCRISNGSNPLSFAHHLYLNDQEVKDLIIPNGVTSIGDYTFSGCSGLTSVTIPDGVTSIGVGAFDGCSGLTSIAIPNGVTSIGGGAFRACSNLTSITIPDGVTSIGNSAFQDCSNLTSITIPGSVTIIGDFAFEYCRKLTSITIPDGVTSIGVDAFNGCSGLNSITIPSSVTSIGRSAFENCSGLTSVYISDIAAWCRISFGARSNPLSYAHHLYLNDQEVKDLTIPDGLTSIGDYAFSGCSGLTSVTIPSGITSIGGSAFSGCSGLTSITIPDGVTSIGNSTFSGCSGLNSITIPNGVTSIGGDAFFGCYNLTSITIPDGVMSIGERAFWNCKGLASVTIPNSVTSIGDDAFYGCSGLTKVQSLIEIPFEINDEVFDSGNNQFTSATLYVPAGTKALYEDTEGWKNFKNIVEIMIINPVDNDDSVDYGKGGITVETDLSGTVVANMYYNIGTDAGGYSAEDGYIVITKETSNEQMEALEGLGITDEELKQNFTGIIFKVPAGKGKVTVTAETTGNMTLKVKVGSGETVEMELSGKLKKDFPFNVSEESLVYIFAGTADEGSSRGQQRASSEESCLRIYGIELEIVPRGDVNGDTKVDAADVMALANYIVGNGTLANEAAADVNGDTKVDIADVAALIGIIGQ
ncbi:MAG: leucine-rich repeat protein [Prevotella sp.]|nr:leucine-rich repeat protein [Prevotella sp.]